MVEKTKAKEKPKGDRPSGPQSVEPKKAKLKQQFFEGVKPKRLIKVEQLAAAHEQAISDRVSAQNVENTSREALLKGIEEAGEREYTFNGVRYVVDPGEKKLRRYKDKDGEAEEPGPAVGEPEKSEKKNGEGKKKQASNEPPESTDPIPAPATAEKGADAPQAI